MNLTAVDTDALERALFVNPLLEDERAELERRAGVDGEAGTDARAALTRLDEAAARDAAAQAAAGAAPEPSAEATAAAERIMAKAAGIDVRLEVRRDPAAQAIMRYFERRQRLAALPVRDTQAARLSKLELELGEALDALMEVAQALNITIPGA